MKELVIIGAGRIGGALAAASPAPCTVITLISLITRDHGWDVLERPAGDPVLVCVRNDDLNAVLERVPPARRPDLVFVQNGMIDPWLAAHDLRDNTRGVLFFAVPARGAAIEPGGISPFTGRHAVALAEWLPTLGVPAQAVDRPRFAAVMLEKLIWNAAFGLLCERHAITVGAVLVHHAAALKRLVAELNAVGRAALRVRLDDASLLARLRRFSASIPDNRAGIKEWRWRVGWFVSAAREHAIATPVHDRLIAELPRPPTA